jgi:hypothetical protein
MMKSLPRFRLGEPQALRALQYATPEAREISVIRRCAEAVTKPPALNIPTAAHASDSLPATHKKAAVR